MIGLDTNVLVRHLTQDDPNQDERAAWTALARYQDGFDFADALIAETNAAETATFDRRVGNTQALPRSIEGQRLTR